MINFLLWVGSVPGLILGGVAAFVGVTEARDTPQKAVVPAISVAWPLFHTA